mmetsp:Transcript_11791/g.31820  ORF Transcript_11791/g.31820 Transcript_11791/m.31820 type:complete len:282 (-) Transcript_11791:6628-7473(-)
MKQDADHTRKTAAVDMELGLPCRVRCARRARFAPVVCAWRAWSRWESANAGAHCVRRMVWCVCRSAERASGGASTRRCHHPLRRRAPHSPPGPCRTRLERQRRSGFDFAGHMTATCWRPRRSVPRTSSKRRRSLRTAGRTLLTAGRSPGFGPGSQPIAGHTLRTAGRTRLTAGRSPGFGPGSQPIAGRTLRTAERIPGSAAHSLGFGPHSPEIVGRIPATAWRIPGWRRRSQRTTGSGPHSPGTASRIHRSFGRHPRSPGSARRCPPRRPALCARSCHRAR